MDKKKWLGEYQNNSTEDEKDIEISIGIIPILVIVGLIIWSVVS